MNTETEEYKGYIAYYIFGEYCGDRRYTLKIMKTDCDTGTPKVFRRAAHSFIKFSTCGETLKAYIIENLFYGKLFLIIIYHYVPKSSGRQKYFHNISFRVAYNIAMWSNVVSIEKGDDKMFSELLSGIEGIKELSSAVEESKNRKYIYMAGLCEYADEIRDKIENFLSDFILTKYKLSYYSENLKYDKLDYPVATLISTLVYLDFDLEKAFVTRVLRELSSYDVDAIYRFRLKALRASWKEVAEMCARLFEVGTDEQDIYNVINYISATKTAKPLELVLEKAERPVFRNAGNGKEIAVKRLFGVDEYDIIGTVISLSATKLTLNCDVAGEAVKALRHVVRVKMR